MTIELIRLISNEVIIAEVVDKNDEFITLDDPFALIATNDGKITFVPWSPLSEDNTSIKMYTRHVVYYAVPGEEVIQNYKEIFSTIVTPQNSGKIIT